MRYIAACTAGMGIVALLASERHIHSRIAHRIRTSVIAGCDQLEGFDVDLPRKIVTMMAVSDALSRFRLILIALATVACLAVAAVWPRAKVS